MEPSTTRSNRLVLYAFAVLGLLLPPLLYWRVLPSGAFALDAGSLPFRPASLYEQYLAVLTFFGVKFVYTILSALIIVVLWQRKEPDLAALRRSMLAFFAGEAFCFVNVMRFEDASVPLEHLHSVGMVLCFAYAAYALIEAVDTRLIRFSGDGRCAAATLCGVCTRSGDDGCNLRRLMLWLLPAVMLAAAIPLTSNFCRAGYHTLVFRTPHTYVHRLPHQYYELRYLPLAAIILLALCFISLLPRRQDFSLAKILLAAAGGAIGFSFFRFVLVAGFADNLVWFDAWEEMTELIYVAGAGAMLLVFSGGLFRQAVA